MNATTERIHRVFMESLAIKTQLLPDLVPFVTQSVDRIVACLQAGGKIMVCGNGGSAADAQHFSAELLNRFERERRPLAAMALSTDTSTLTSIANDYDYRQVFSKQVQALAKPEDVLLAISTSGESANVIAAIEKMQQLYNAYDASPSQGCVVALTGKDGGRMAKQLMANDIEIRVAHTQTPRIQEIHIMVLHAICDSIDQMLFG